MKYKVTGMSCAACSARVEKAVSSLEGVSECSVNLLTKSMNVEGTSSEDEIMNAVSKAGYGAIPENSSSAGQADTSASALRDNQASEEQKEISILTKRLIASLVFLAMLMYCSMGHMMWQWPLPEIFNGNHVALGLLQLLLTAVIMVINNAFFINGFRGLIHTSPNMDTLVSLGASAAFVYSTVRLFEMTSPNWQGGMDFYFESAGTILTLITLGKLLEARSKGKTTNALRSLMSLAPKTATVLQDGKEITVSVDAVKSGDIVIIRPGESIPVDGTVIEGISAVDESALTGESIPVDKTAGCTVSAGTVNHSGVLKFKASGSGKDTLLAKIVQTVADASASKAPVSRIADRVSAVFVPVVISIAIVTIAAWLLLGHPIGYALARGISVLVISCPCALGLATPVAIMVGSGVGARRGILFKTAASLEEAGKADIVALDKTGTVTEGKPVVTDIIPIDGTSERNLLAMAYSLEKYSEHPLARAITAKAEETGISPASVTDFEIIPGKGLRCTLGGDSLAGGNRAFAQSLAEVPKALLDKSDELSETGRTPLFFIRNDTAVGIIAVADKIRDDSPEAIARLKEMGLRVVMITGDNEKSARAIGENAGIDEIVAGVLPDEKGAEIKRLRGKGRVLMAGDGINDAPALTEADTGVAIGAGTDIAIDSANVVLMRDSLCAVADAISLSRATLKNIHENLFWAFIYNTIGIPLAAGLFSGLLGWQLNPSFAAAAMSLSSFCVVTNALRLNFFGRNKKINNTNNGKGNDIMKKTMSITGMMCMHCEAHTKAALEAIPGVESAVASHEKGEAIVTLTEDVSDDALKKAVEDQGYQVNGISQK